METEADREIPGLVNHVFPRRQQVGRGWLDVEGLRLRTGLTQACSWAASWKTWAIALCPRFRSPARGQTGGVVAEAIENLTTQGALCVLAQEGGAEAVL